MNHDKLFKELLTTFFVEFVELFLPDVSAYLDRDSLEFLDKEVFTDITTGERHEVDVLVKARFRGQEAFFLIHVENQASAQSEFSQRMFRYFARLYEKYNLPVYPIVIFSYDTPYRAEPKQHQVAFPGFVVNTFHYRVIQLNRLSWRKFVQQPNPVAVALMTKMKIAPQDRARVKVQCLRLLLTLQLNPAKSELIYLFMERYLQLSSEEQRRYQAAVDALPQAEKEKTMELVSSYRLQGREEGRAEGRMEGRAEGRTEGKAEMLLRQMTRRFGDVPAELQTRLNALSPAQLDELAVALFDFTGFADVEKRIPQLTAGTPQ